MLSNVFAEDHIVVQKNKTFSEKTMIIKVGDNVVFKNEDQVIHSVYSSSAGQDFVLESQLPGKASSMRFSHPGKLEVECAIHPNMKLIIEVEK